MIVEKMVNVNGDVLKKLAAVINYVNAMKNLKNVRRNNGAKLEMIVERMVLVHLGMLNLRQFFV